MNDTVNNKKLEGLKLWQILTNRTIFAKLYSPIAKISLISTHNSGWICRTFFHPTDLLADLPNFVYGMYYLLQFSTILYSPSK